MKRFFCTLLCVLLLAATLPGSVSAAATTGFRLAAGTDRFTLSADEAYTNTVTFASGSYFPVEGLQTMLSKAGKAVTKPVETTEVARIATFAGDEKRSYILLKSGNSYYMERATVCREISYADVDEFLAGYIENRTGLERLTFYKFNNPPQASSVVDGAKCSWGATAGTYQYRRLNGQFQAIRMGENDSLSDVIAKTRSAAIPIPAFAQKPDSVTYSVYRNSDGKLLWTGTEAEAKQYSLTGQSIYCVAAAAEYNTFYYRGTVDYALNLDRSSTIQFSVEGSDTYLGEAVVLKVTGTTASDPLATFTSDISLNLPPAFHRRSDGSQVALFPVSYRNTAGSHWIEITCGDQKARFTVSARDKNWQIQNLTVDASTTAETIESQKANDEYERVIAPLRSVEDDTQHWSGRFILPCSDDKVTTQFGMIRYVNGQPTSTRHGAVDLAVPRGTPVKATGAGRVLYAGYLQLTGNTVLIEHGYGLKSWYYHMDSLSVKSGDMVTQAQVIGAVGSTGFSTGPHLHFGMSVNNVFINPYTAIKTDLFVE